MNFGSWCHQKDTFLHQSHFAAYHCPSAFYLDNIFLYGEIAVYSNQIVVPYFSQISAVKDCDSVFFFFFPSVGIYNEENFGSGPTFNHVDIFLRTSDKNIALGYVDFEKCW